MSPVSLRVTNCWHDEGDSNCSVIIHKFTTLEARTELQLKCAHPTVVSGMVTGEAPISYRLIFYPCPE